MTRPNNPPERLDTNVVKRPAQMILHGHPHERNKKKRESWANMLHERAQINLGSQLSIFDKRFYMVACTTETKPQGRAGQTIYTNMHKANLGSQLSIFDMGSFARVPPRPNDPPEQPARTT